MELDQEPCIIPPHYTVISIEDDSSSDAGSEILKLTYKSDFKSDKDVWLLCHPDLIKNKILLHEILLLDQKKAFVQLPRKMRREFQFTLCHTMDQAKRYVSKKLVQTVILDVDTTIEQLKWFEQSGIKNIVIMTKLEDQITIVRSKTKKGKWSFGRNPKWNLNEFQYNLGKFLATQCKNYCTELPNFIVLNQQELLEFNRKRITHYSIEKPEGSDEAALKDFIKFCEWYFVQESEIEQFKNLQKTWEKDPLEVLKQYTRETLFHKIINKFLKIVNHPSEAAWFRYPYSKLKLKIKQQHQKQNLTEDFTVYRGLFISQKQAQSLQKDKIYQSMGFLSTSRKIQVAKTFIKNALVTIHVHDPKKQSEGFCYLEDIASIKGEEQVIFNTNNLFKIKRIGLQQNIWEIILELVVSPPKQFYRAFQHTQKYKSLSQGYALQQFSPNMAKVYYQKKKEQQVKNLGNMHMKKGEFRMAQQLYNETLLKVQETQIQFIAAIIIKKATILQKKKLYNEAIKILTEALIYIQSDSSIAGQIQRHISSIQYEQAEYEQNVVFKEKQLNQKAANLKILARFINNIYGPDHIQTVSTISDHAEVHMLNKNYDQALKLYNNILKIYQHTYGKEHYEKASIINKMAVIYKLQEKYDQALDMLMQALNINIGSQNILEQIDILSNIAEVHFMNKDYQIAIQFDLKVLEILKNDNKPDYHAEAKIIQNLINAYSQTGQLIKAANFSIKKLDLQAKKLSSGNNKLLYDRKDIIFSNFEQQEYFGS